MPFKLTNAQLKVIDAILKDMSSENSMRRLLQGDVGSGKTIVAFISAYANYLCGYQTSLMAPTEILAKQHYENALKLTDRRLLSKELMMIKYLIQYKRGNKNDII